MRKRVSGLQMVEMGIPSKSLRYVEISSDHGWIDIRCYKRYKRRLRELKIGDSRPILDYSYLHVPLDPQLQKELDVILKEINREY